MSQINVKFVKYEGLVKKVIKAGNYLRKQLAKVRLQTVNTPSRRPAMTWAGV